jgi:hypothetical protein
MIFVHDAERSVEAALIRIYLTGSDIRQARARLRARSRAARGSKRAGGGPRGLAGKGLHQARPQLQGPKGRGWPEACGGRGRGAGAASTPFPRACVPSAPLAAAAPLCPSPTRAPALPRPQVGRMSGKWGLLWGALVTPPGALAAENASLAAAPPQPQGAGKAP